MTKTPEPWRIPLNWFGLLRIAPIRETFYRQVYFTGIQAMDTVMMRGSVIGTLIIAYLIKVLNADVAMTAKILLLFVFREVGPLLAAILVIFRSGSAITSELALMKISGETRMLHRLGINLFDFLVVPRVLGVSLATLMLTFYLQVIILAGGFLFAPLLIDTNINHLFEAFLDAASLADIGASVIKGLEFGIIISVVACYSGLSVSGAEPSQLPQVVTKAMMRAFGFVMLFEVTFSYIVYGVLMFGLVEAEH